MNSLESQTPPLLTEDISRPPSGTLTEEKTPPNGPTFMETLRRVSPADWTLLILLVCLFVPMFRELMQEWDAPHAPQSYGYLILPAAAFLAWMMRSRGAGVPQKPALSGLGLAFAGILLTWGGSLLGSMTIAAVGFVVTTAGAVSARFGTEILRRFWFPIAYLTAIIPLPHEFMNQMTFSLQQMSVKFAAGLLKVFGEVNVEGTRIHLSSYTLDVIAPCSGMTIILPLLVLTVYYLYLMVSPLWKKVVIFLLAIPISLIVNAVRVALIGVVGEAFGGKAAANFHDYSGFLTVGAGFAVLFYVAKEMKCSQISDDIVL